MPMNFAQKANYRMMRLMARVMPSCKDISSLISKGMDEHLPLHKRLSIRLHISMCKYCRRYEKQLRLLQEGVSRYADPETNTAERTLSSEAKERLNRALEREAK